MTKQRSSTTRALLATLATSILGIAFACLPAHAQAAKTATSSMPLDVAITYQASLFGRTAAPGSFAAQGGAIELHGRLYHGFGVVASVTGQHASASMTGGAPFDLVVAAFGPRYTYAPTHRTSVFAEVLAGEANAFNSVFPGKSGNINTPGNAPTDSASSLAVLAGGGLDLKLTPHFTIRAIQADWLRTQLPNGQNNIQNSVRIGAGIVYKWGRP